MTDQDIILDYRMTVRSIGKSRDISVQGLTDTFRRSIPVRSAMKDATEGLILVPVGDLIQWAIYERFAERGATDATKTNKDGRTFYVFADGEEQFTVSSSNGLPAAYLSVQKDSKTLVTRTLEVRTLNRPGTPSSPDDLDERTQELEPLQLGIDSLDRPTVSLAGVFLDETGNNDRIRSGRSLTRQRGL